MKHSIIALVLFQLLVLSGCGRVDQQRATSNLAERPIYAIATIGMVTDIVQQVGGERVVVRGLMGPGVDPHLYKASEGDVTRLAEADVVFYNGLHLEAAMTKVLERMHGRVRAVAVTDTIDRSLLSRPPEFEGNYDPHVWFHVPMWMRAVEQVRDTLAEMDPSSAGVYKANAERYLGELENLHEYVKRRAAEVAPEQRVLITAHDAFNYFGEAYGFEVRGLQGISTSTEAGTADVQALANFIAERKIRAIFIESSVPQRNVEAVQAAVRARGFDVRIGGELFSDAMGTPGTPEGTYIGMIRHNIDTIVNALAA